MIQQLRNVSEAKKRNVAGKQHFKCANKPGIEIKGLGGYECPLWKIKGIKQGSFDESGYDIDHIMEHSISNNDNIDNLQALCKMCHSTKTKRFLMINTCLRNNFLGNSNFSLLGSQPSISLNDLTVSKLKQLCENFEIVYVQNIRKKDLVDKFVNISQKKIVDYINLVNDKQYMIKCYGCNGKILSGKKIYHIFYSNTISVPSPSDKKYDHFLSKNLFCPECMDNCICHEYENEFYKYNKIIESNDKKGNTSPNSENTIMGNFLSNPFPLPEVSPTNQESLESLRRIVDKNILDSESNNIFPLKGSNFPLSINVNNGLVLFSKLTDSSNNGISPIPKMDGDDLDVLIPKRGYNTEQIIDKKTMREMLVTNENAFDISHKNIIGKYKVVCVETVEIKKEPKYMCEYVGTAYPNDIFDVYEIINDWIEILYLNEIGYIKITDCGTLQVEKFEEKPIDNSVINNVIDNVVKDVINSVKDCCVCLEKIDEKYVLIPCGHTSICVKCIKKINKKCPICVQKFETFIKIYD